MRDLTPAEFAAEFTTYWGRRSLGLVMDNPHVAQARMASPDQVLTMAKYWNLARDAFPEPSNLRLMGTPALAPEYVLRWHPALPAPSAPPAPVIGPFVTADGSLSETVGDLTFPFRVDEAQVRGIRAVLRGRYALGLGILGVLLAPWVNVLAAMVALVGMVLAIGAIPPANRLKAAPLYRATLWIGLAVSAVAIVVAVVSVWMPMPVPA